MPEDFDHLVGAIALSHVRDRFRNRVAEEDFDGGFHVLSGFTPRQLAGFARALLLTPDFASNVRIRFSAQLLSKEGIPQEFLTERSAVKIRNEPYEGKLVIAAELEKDAGTSLSEFDRTDIEQIRHEASVEAWIDQLCNETKVSLIDEHRKQLAAALKGLFRTARSNPKNICAFLYQTLANYETEGQIMRSAGGALPHLDLPLFRKCFSSIPVGKLNHASAWEKAFQSHAVNSHYLQKRDSHSVLLDPDDLRGRLEDLRNDQNPALPDEILASFQSYIKAKGARSVETEALLFGFDWEFVRHCFEKSKVSAAADFIQKTRDVLHGDDVKLTEEEDAILDQLGKQQPRPGNADEDVVDFFKSHASSIAQDARLLSQWESLVHGTRVSCEDLFDGIVQCIERSWNRRTPGKGCRLKLVGKGQEKPNRFLTKNRAACCYFERHYSQLQQLTKGHIRFEKTLVIQYRQQEEWLNKNGAGKKKAGSKKANTLEFEVVVEESKPQSNQWIEVDRLLLEWKFNNNSILSEEAADFARLALLLGTSAKTTLISTLANYEAVGRKGSPLPVSLPDIQGLSETFGAGGRGSVVPAKKDANAHSLLKQWDKELAEAKQLRFVSEPKYLALTNRFKAFQEKYDKLIPELARNALFHTAIPEMVSSYRDLVLDICELSHEALRRRLLRLVLTVGNTQVEKSGNRPPLSIICPWHPLRIEATAARAEQFANGLTDLLHPTPATFSDTSGKLFFHEFKSLLSQPLYPEVSVVWDASQPQLRMVSQNLCDYSLHEPPAPEEGLSVVVQDESKAAARQIEEILEEYLRLQPHERDNLSVALYNCDSASLPSAVVTQINAFNDKRLDDEVTCQLFLMHRDEDHLRNIYRELVGQGTGSAESSPAEATGDFLSKVRVNIVAANAIPKSGRSQPIDIAYCKDLVSRKAKLNWVRRTRIVRTPEDLQPHQWSRKLPLDKGIRQATLQLCCPAQTEAGWAYLYALASLLYHDAKDAWEHNKCPVPMKILDFDTKDIHTIFADTHQLATWVVNQDEILDRRLLEAQDIKVIRYVQSATQGRNLVISSKAKDTLLVNTLKEKLRDILPPNFPEEKIQSLAQRFIQEANQISGGLVLKAARRAKNTNELLGMVLSRFLVQTEIGHTGSAAWCFLDDYAQWLGKREEAQIADLLILSPLVQNGERILNIIITEAKFIHGDAIADQGKCSERQLRDTLGQLEGAILGDAASLDQSIWLSRLSDLMLTRLEFAPGQPHEDLEAWRVAIRDRKCKIRIWGYSHVFTYAPAGLTPPASKRVPKTQNGIQEFFSPSQVRELILMFEANDLSKLKQVRDYALLEELDSAPKSIAEPAPAESKSEASSTSAAEKPATSTPPPKDDDTSNGSDDSGGTFVPVTPPQPKPSEGGAAVAPVASPGLISYLENHSKHFATSKNEGTAWLKETTARLKSAFLARQLPFKLAEGFEPILTPNAGILRLQGSSQLTVPMVEAKSQEIYTSDGIQIIAVNPEPGRLRLTIARPVREMLHTETLLLEFLKQNPRAAAGEQLLVGIREEDGQPLLLNPYNQPHTLIAGATGSGKSVLMQNIILSIAATRSVEQAKVFLIDPKYGVDYLQLQSLPHVQGGIIDSQERALATLNAGVEEMENRYKLFKAAGPGIVDIRAYRKVTGKTLPTWWLIHDEFADWMQVEEYREAIPQIVNRLSVKARAAGIFLIFAAQRPDNMVFPVQMRDQLGNRLILKVQSVGTSEIALGEKGAERLLGKGHMLAKIGGEASPAFVQVPYIDPIESIPPLVEIISAIHKQNT
jgi:S-DNA-T family DNA segregation ATPase FtsK/SpoIIIE